MKNIAFILTFVLWLGIATPAMAFSVLGQISDGGSFNGGSATPIAYTITGVQAGECVLFTRGYSTAFGQTVGTPLANGAASTLMNSGNLSGVSYNIGAWAFKATSTGVVSFTFTHTSDNARVGYVLGLQRITGTDCTKTASNAIVTGNGSVNTINSTLASAVGRMAWGAGVISVRTNISYNSTLTQGVQQQDSNPTASFIATSIANAYQDATSSVFIQQNATTNTMGLIVWDMNPAPATAVSSFHFLDFSKLLFFNKFSF